MTNLSNPEKIYNDFINKRRNKKETVEILITFLEGAIDINVIIDTLNIFDKLEVKSKKLFNIVENLLISDDNHLVRSAAAKIIVKHFIKEVVSPIKWTINHERSSIVLKTLLASFEKVDNEYTQALKRELLSSIFGVVPEEIKFFLDFDALIEDYMELNVDFYKDFQTDDINDVIRGRAVYAIKESHVVGLNLAGWTMSIHSITAGSSVRSHKSIGSFISSLPKSVENLKKLKILDLSHCSALLRLPKSICHLKELQVLNLRNCFMLRKIPQNIGDLRSLEVLDLRLCYNIREFPESVCNLQNLKELRYSGEWHKMSWLSVPKCIGNLQNLEILELGGCNRLMSLPESIGNLLSLRELDLSYCNNLRTLPESMNDLTCLKKLNLEGCTALESIPDSLNELESLTVIR